MNEAAYTDTESRLAKRLKKLSREEGCANWTHMQCLRLVREYAHVRNGMSAEVFAAYIFAAETGRTGE